MNCRCRSLPGRHSGVVLMLAAVCPVSSDKMLIQAVYLEHSSYYFGQQEEQTAADACVIVSITMASAFISSLVFFNIYYPA